jgi:GntR family transcriptional regulator
MTEIAARGVPLDVPMYKDIKRQLMRSLTEGEWKPGEAIPAERRLAERFGSSIGTLRKAIDELVAENILIRQQGRGTFVASHDRDRLLFYYFHIVSESGPKASPDVDFVSFARARADKVAAERLNIDAGDPVFRVRNRLSLEGRPIMVDDITFAAARFRGMTEARFRDRPSTIYNLYQEEFGVSVVRTSERLRATVADAEFSGLLGIKPGDPLLQIRRVALTYNDDPVEYRLSLVNTAQHEYWAEIGAN